MPVYKGECDWWLAENWGALQEMLDSEGYSDFDLGETVRDHFREYAPEEMMFVWMEFSQREDDEFYLKLARKGFQVEFKKACTDPSCTGCAGTGVHPYPPFHRERHPRDGRPLNVGQIQWEVCWEDDLDMPDMFDYRLSAPSFIWEEFWPHGALASTEF